MRVSEAAPERPRIDLDGPVPGRRTEAEIRDFLAETHRGQPIREFSRARLKGRALCPTARLQIS